MKIFIAIIATLFTTTFAQADTVEYACFEKDHVGDMENQTGIQAMIGVFAPKTELEISVAYLYGDLPIFDSEPVTLDPVVMADGPRIYKGAKYSLEIDERSAPIVEGTHTYSPSTLNDGKNKTEMKCRTAEAVGGEL